MAKVKRFKLVHHEPFIFEGDNGEYQIPPLEQLTYDDWKDVADLLTNGAKTDTKKLLDAYKTFFAKACPELENESIGDNQWLQLGSVYFDAMGE